jgi:hypothetical protein
LKSILRPGQKVQLATNVDSGELEYAILRDPYVAQGIKYTESIVLLNAATSDKLLARQLQTDSAVISLDANAKAPALGGRYGFYLNENGYLIGAQALSQTNTLIVSRYLDGRIFGTDEKGTALNMSIPQATAYYYNGAKITYDQWKASLQKDSTVILGWNLDQSGYDYLIAYDPVYNAPQVADDKTATKDQIGTVQLNQVTIVRDGKIVTKSDIIKNDTIYRVTDIFGKNEYVLVVTTKVGGVFKGYYPTTLAPQTVSVEVYNSDTKKFEVKSYEISKDSFITAGAPLFESGNYVNVLLGYNGKVVDVVTP